MRGYMRGNVESSECVNFHAQCVMVGRYRDRGVARGGVEVLYYLSKVSTGGFFLVGLVCFVFLVFLCCFNQACKRLKKYLTIICHKIILL